MGRLSHKSQTGSARATRVRTKIAATADRPRLCVTVSNTAIYAQIIDDTTHKTVAQSSSLSIAKGSLSEKAVAVGESIAAEAKKAGVTKVVLDRGSKQYHGRIKALADAARKAGLEF